MPLMGRTMVSIAESAGWFVAGRRVSVAGELFDKVRLESGFTDGGEIWFGRRLDSVQAGCADAYLVNLRSRHLTQRAGHALHACSAVHAIDLEEQLGHIPPPPMQVGCRFPARDANCHSGEGGLLCGSKR